MMMIPRKKHYDLFDEMFDDSFFGAGEAIGKIMKTDIKEKGDNYVIHMDLPGYDKDDIKIEIDNGYLTINATTNKVINDENEEERYIHKERYIGNCSRSFYVGENVKQEDVKASFKNGTLILTFPKKDGKKLEEKKYIAIDD